MNVLENRLSSPDSPGAVEHHGLRPVIYTSVVIIPLAAMLLFGFWTAASSSFLSTLADPYLQISDYAYTQKDVDCQVVIYGDSTALTGVNPLIIEQYTHLKTCNISVTMAAFVMNGTLAFDRYLAQNRRPKYVIFQLAEVAVPRQLFAAIVKRIARLRLACASG